MNEKRLQISHCAPACLCQLDPGPNQTALNVPTYVLVELGVSDP